VDVVEQLLLHGGHGLTTSWLTTSVCLSGHTADFIASELEAVLTEWSITKSTVNVVTDSGASVKKAVSQMGVDRWHPCYAAAVRERQHGSQGCY